MSKQKTVLIILGTRPEAIKMAPVIQELRARPRQFRTVVCSTGQPCARLYRSQVGTPKAPSAPGQ